MKVCVVEDDAIMLDHLVAQLEALGCDVVGAGDVDTALKRIDSFHPDALLVDILMPEKDGLTLIMELQRRRSEMRVVAITGGGRLGAGLLLKMADALGAHATLVKPVSGDDLRAALQLA